MNNKELIQFIYFILDEFIDNIDTNIYYDKYENMDKDIFILKVNLMKELKER